MEVSKVGSEVFDESLISRVISRLQIGILDRFIAMKLALGLRSTPLYKIRHVIEAYMILSRMGGTGNR